MLHASGHRVTGYDNHIIRRRLYRHALFTKSAAFSPIIKTTAFVCAAGISGTGEMDSNRRISSAQFVAAKLKKSTLAESAKTMSPLS